MEELFPVALSQLFMNVYKHLLMIMKVGWNPRNSMESRLSASFPSFAYSLPLVYFFSLGGIEGFILNQSRTQMY